MCSELSQAVSRAEVRRSFITTTVREEHHNLKGATGPGRFELETNGFQFCAMVNLDKTSLVW